MAARAGRIARIRYNTTFQTFTSQASSISGDALTVTVDSTARRHWNPNSTAFPVIKRVVGGTTSTISTGISNIDYVNGSVTFETTQNSSATWKMDVRNAPMSYLPDSRGWTLNVETDMLDVTTFSTGVSATQWRSIIAGRQTATVTIDKLFGASTAPPFIDLPNTTGPIMVELWTDSTTEARYQGWAELETDTLGVDGDDPVTEGVTLRLITPLSYSTW